MKKWVSEGRIWFAPRLWVVIEHLHEEVEEFSVITLTKTFSIKKELKQVSKILSTNYLNKITYVHLPHPDVHRGPRFRLL